ncbi:MAG: helix-turn-helix domain-containing protein, partial [Methylococcales bacterium]|nr:helix-turn-helix domain-containing protein [Methylococcales bacterium]
MENFELSEQELTALRKEHRKCQNKRSAYRLNAVILLGSGWTLSDVQDALLIDKSTLTSYVKQYKAGGAKKLIRDN